MRNYVFSFHFGMLDNSKHYSAHEPLLQLHHSCRINQKLIQSPKVSWFELQIELASFLNSIIFSFCPSLVVHVQKYQKAPGEFFLLLGELEFFFSPSIFVPNHVPLTYQ